MKGIDLLILVAVIITVSFVIYVQTPTHAAKQETKTCLTCQGSGKIKCPNCAGFGRVDQKQSAPCNPCKGTGKYSKRLQNSTVTCPFCKGSGSVTTSKHVACTRCRELGWIACPACGGSGQKANEPEQDSIIQRIKNWFK